MTDTLFKTHSSFAFVRSWSLEPCSRQGIFWDLTAHTHWGQARWWMARLPGISYYMLNKHLLFSVSLVTIFSLKMDPMTKMLYNTLSTRTRHTLQRSKERNAPLCNLRNSGAANSWHIRNKATLARSTHEIIYVMGWSKVLCPGTCRNCLCISCESKGSAFTVFRASL